MSEIDAAHSIYQELAKIRRTLNVPSFNKSSSISSPTPNVPIGIAGIGIDYHIKGHAQRCGYHSSQTCVTTAIAIAGASRLISASKTNTPTPTMSASQFILDIQQHTLNTKKVQQESLLAKEILLDIHYMSSIC
ncbi:14501_t:CDS:2 [Entrophospora sp. SA101]|nr:14501_t:CDS:2 [Entrophospora sp. SA101]